MLCNTTTVVCNQDFKQYCIQATGEKREHYGCIDLFSLCAVRSLKGQIFFVVDIYFVEHFYLKNVQYNKMKNQRKKNENPKLPLHNMILAFRFYLYSHAQSYWCFIYTKSLDSGSFTGTAISLDRNVYRSTKICAYDRNIDCMIT